jgi:hypothetical protein
VRVLVITASFSMKGILYLLTTSNVYIVHHMCEMSSVKDTAYSNQLQCSGMVCIVVSCDSSLVVWHVLGLSVSAAVAHYILTS